MAKITNPSPPFANEGVKKRRYDNILEVNVLTKNIAKPIWLSISEAAKIGGVRAKTIRRAIQSKIIKYKIVKNRYFVDLGSMIIYLHTKNKLKNKLKQFGIGQYIEKWRG